MGRSPGFHPGRREFESRREYTRLRRARDPVVSSRVDPEASDLATPGPMQPLGRSSPCSSAEEQLPPTEHVAGSTPVRGSSTLVTGSDGTDHGVVDVADPETDTCPGCGSPPMSTLMLDGQYRLRRFCPDEACNVVHWDGLLTVKLIWAAGCGRTFDHLQDAQTHLGLCEDGCRND